MTLYADAFEGTSEGESYKIELENLLEQVTRELAEPVPLKHLRF